MKPATRLLALIAFVALLAGCAPADAPAAESPKVPTVEIEAPTQLLWESTVEPYLQDPLWNDRDIYDAGHALMPVLEVAFRSGQTAWQDEFADHFARFTVAEKEGSVSDQRLWRLHYFYLASRFVNLASTYGRTEIVPSGLAEFLTEEIRSIWSDQDAVQWDAVPFHGMKARVEWKLDNLDPDPGYLRAMTDEELFSFAIAADLRVYERQTKAEPSRAVTDILDVAARVLKQESSYPGDGWLFQVGVWSDHPDYAYAGSLSALTAWLRKNERTLRLTVRTRRGGRCGWRACATPVTAVLTGTGCTTRFSIGWGISSPNK